jgi:hypothetical protein
MTSLLVHGIKIILYIYIFKTVMEYFVTQLDVHS